MRAHLPAPDAAIGVLATGPARAATTLRMGSRGEKSYADHGCVPGGTGERRPAGGAVAWHVRPGYQACTYTCRLVHPGVGTYFLYPST